MTSLLNTTKLTKHLMSELGKMEEGRAKDMNPYQSPRKAKTGLSSDRLPQELREFTPAEIKNSVKEAGRGYWTCPVDVHTNLLSKHL